MRFAWSTDIFSLLKECKAPVCLWVAPETQSTFINDNAKSKVIVFLEKNLIKTFVFMGSANFNFGSWWD